MEADLSDAFLCRSGHRTIRVERRVKSGLVTPQIAPRGHPCLLWLPRPSWVGPRPAARTLQERIGWEWPDRMMDRCQQIILGLILGTEPTATPPPLPQRRFFQSRSRPPGAKPICPSNLELITALAIKFRFHLVLWTTKLTRPSGPIFRSEVGYMPPPPPRIC